MKKEPKNVAPTILHTVEASASAKKAQEDIKCDTPDNAKEQLDNLFSNEVAHHNSVKPEV